MTNVETFRWNVYFLSRLTAPSLQGYGAAVAQVAQESRLKSSTLKAIFTDSHFWVPVVVLVLGVVLLAFLK